MLSHKSVSSLSLVLIFLIQFTIESNKLPSSINVFQKGLISKSLCSISAIYFGLGTTSKILADDGNGIIYTDQGNMFQINQADGWTLMPRASKVSLSQYMHEEITLVGTNFVEGASLSVTKSRARQLLKDMQIEWWFDNLSTIKDLGSANLIAELLILQRQGDFDKRQTPSEITSAIINIDTNSLLFEYLTPLTAEVYRKTIVKAYYIPGEDKLMSCWISGLAEIFKTESSYSNKLYEILNSFVML